MSIVVLDGYTLNPGDLSWNSLQSLWSCTIYDRTPPEDVISRAAEASIVLVNKVFLPAAVIEALPKLRYVGVLATGYNCVDVEAARRRGIVVTNVPTYGTASVAQMAIAHILNLANRVGCHARTVHEGRWTTAADWCYWDHPLTELAGLTLGVVGFGRIGQATARIATALGMRVLACDSRPVPPIEGVMSADLETLFRTSDVISLHCPLTAENARMVNQRRLAMMKPTAVLVNTSRGGLIDEEALAEALNSGRIAGAGLDVLSVEPPPADHPLVRARNCFITPHIAWATRAARARLLDIVVENIRGFLAGRPQNVVNL